MMGVWFMFQSLGNILGGFVAAEASITNKITDSLQSLPVYSELFLKIGLITLTISIIMAIAVPKLKKHI